jgi:hypothetical protein
MSVTMDYPKNVQAKFDENPSKKQINPGIFAST